MQRAPWVVIGLLISWLAMRPCIVGAQGERSEYEVKAVCLYNFFKFVDWPKNAVPDDEKTFHLGVLGPDPFADHLKAVSERQVKGKKIVIQRFKAANDVRPCHLLFVSSQPAGQETAEKRLEAALAAVKDRAVLLVGDKEGWAAKGVVINVLIEKSRPVLEVNIDAEKRSGVKIDTQLLDLARIVRDAKE